MTDEQKKQKLDAEIQFFNQLLAAEQSDADFDSHEYNEWLEAMDRQKAEVLRLKKELGITEPLAKFYF